MTRYNMEEEKKKTLDVISSFLKHGIKKHDNARANTTSSTTTNSSKDEDEWIFLVENQIDERRKNNVQQISIFLIVVGMVLLYVNYFDVLRVIIGKEGGTIISRIINLGAAFVITVTGLIIRDNTKDVEY